VLDLGVELGVIEKRGSFFTYADQRIGQGRENAREGLKANPGLLLELETLIHSEAARRLEARGGDAVVEEVMAQLEAA
jgi:recombination protein RecA